MYRYGLPAPTRSAASSDATALTATAIVSAGLDQMESVPTVLATSDANERYIIIIIIVA